MNSTTGATRTYTQVGNFTKDKSPRLSICIFLSDTILYYLVIFISSFTITIIFQNCEMAMQFCRETTGQLFLGEIWVHFVRREHFAGLIAWPTQWRVAGKIHLNSLSQGLPPPLILQQVSTKVHLPSYFPSWEAEHWEPAVSALPGRINGQFWFWFWFRFRLPSCKLGLSSKISCGEDRSNFSPSRIWFGRVDSQALLNGGSFY